MQYRKEIDGLRAIAVIAVILFHLNIPGFNGGFTGVDIFLVISGYLITSIIVSETQSGNFSFKLFYERRARRILPALYLVILASIPFAWLWLLPADLKYFSKSLASAPVFLSNFLFTLESGYFDAAAELKPLLHTWSLAVEIQFYLLFPVFFCALLRLKRTWAITSISAIALISFALTYYIGERHPIVNFFLIPTRLWEFLIGSTTAIFIAHQETYTTKSHNPRLIHAELLSLLGFLLIAYSVIFFNKHTPFPGAYTLAPSIGAALIICFSRQGTLIGKLLGGTVLVQLGLMSYSLYLWHYPIVSFLRHRQTQEPNSLLIACIIITTVALSFFSWKFIEVPFRDRTKINSKLFTLIALSLSAALVGCGLIIYMKNGFPARLPGNINPTVFAPPSTQEYKPCNVEIPKISNRSDQNELKTCTFGDKNSKHTIALYGDSHAGALFSALDETFKRIGIKGVRIANNFNDCGVIPSIFVNPQHSSQAILHKTCQDIFDSNLKYISENVDGVIISMRWTMRMYPITGLVDALEFNNQEGGVEYNISPREYIALNSDGKFSAGASAKRNAIENFLRRLDTLNKKIYLVHPVPEVGWDVPRLNKNTYLNTGTIPQYISTSHELFKTRNKFINDSLNNFQSVGNIKNIKPEHLLCNTYQPGRCVAQIDGNPLYYDGNHLSNAGARLIVQEIEKQLR